jgi:branched-chain amino acid transport system permease protein
MAKPSDAVDPIAGPINTAARDERGRALIGGRSILFIFWLVLLATPLFGFNDYIVSLGTSFLINLILIASLNVVIGYCGQISLGHAGFYGLGAYSAGILSAKLGLNPWLGLPVACLVSALAALVIGIPALRLRGHYLAMATLGFNAILAVLFDQLVSWTGGPNGLLGVKALTLGGFALSNQTRIFPLVWLCAGLVMLALLNLIQSRVGRAIRAIATSEVAAQSLGIDVFRYKLIVFVLTAAMAGLAGSLYVESNLYASPETFGFSSSILLVAMVALGGWGHYGGAFLGALIYTGAPELLRTFQDAQLLIFGAGMIAVLLFFPSGLAGAGDSFVRFWRRYRP